MSDVSRRAFLGTGLLAAGAVGIGAGVATSRSSRHPLPHADRVTSSGRSPVAQDPVLVAAIDRETALIERLDSAVAADAALAASAAVLRADHEAHRQALQALLTAGSTAASSSSPAPTPAVTPSAAVRLGTADLIAWEDAAAKSAAHDCAAASARLAPLLASISACEATHVAWLG